MNRRKLVISSGVANLFEWYDYALFGNLATIIGAKFFPEETQTASLLNAFLVFAAGYLMRPIGGIFFGVIGDKHGRKIALSWAVICMSLPTAIIGILPTYESIGSYASLLMIIMRMIQGLSMGGALTGSISFLIEHSNEKKRGLYGSIPMASICLGILLGNIVSFVTKYIVGEVQFLAWGWRIPFILGIFIMFAGYYIRMYTEETPLFKKAESAGKIPKFPLKEAFEKHWKTMLISIAINSTGSIVFYLQAIFVTNYLKINREFSEQYVDQLNGFCYLIMAFVCIFAGKLSDVIGRRRLYVILICLIIPLIFNITYILHEGDWIEVIAAQIALGLLAAMYIGPEPALQAECFPTHIRATGLSVSYNLATSIFGGTTPYIITYLNYYTGDLTGCGYYILIASMFSLIGLYFYKNKSKEIVAYY